MSASGLGEHLGLAVDVETRLIAQIVEGVDALQLHVSAWPFQGITDAHVVGAERSLVGFQVLLTRLRGRHSAIELRSKRMEAA